MQAAVEQAGREQNERCLIDAAGNAQPVRPAPRRGGGEGGGQQASVGRHAAQAGYRETVAARRFGDADDPGAPAAVGEEGAYCGSEVGVQQFAAFGVPDQGQIGAEDAAVLLRTLDRHRLMHRAARSEAGEAGDVHARQRLIQRAGGRDEGDAGLAGGHGTIPLSRVLSVVKVTNNASPVRGELVEP